MTRPDLSTLLAGVAVLALGVVLLLDRTGRLHLDFGSLGPIVLAVVGVILLVSGLAPRDRAG